MGFEGCQNRQPRLFGGFVALFLSHAVTNDTRDEGSIGQKRTVSRDIAKVAHNQRWLIYTCGFRSGGKFELEFGDSCICLHEYRPFFEGIDRFRRLRSDDLR